MSNLTQQQQKIIQIVKNKEKLILCQTFHLIDTKSKFLRIIKRKLVLFFRPTKWSGKLQFVIKVNFWCKKIKKNYFFNFYCIN